jgi:serine protease inhibitor
MTDPILEAQADFALNLLRKVSFEGQAETIVSPTSVAIGLSMVYAGAKYDTAEEMNKLLSKDMKIGMWSGDKTLNSRFFRRSRFQSARIFWTIA